MGARRRGKTGSTSGICALVPFSLSRWDVSGPLCGNYIIRRTDLEFAHRDSLLQTHFNHI